MASYDEFINHHMACNPDELTKYTDYNVKGWDSLICMPLALKSHVYH
jgi:hypothetical protein